MRNLRRNVQRVFYKAYLGEQELLDEYGDPTGCMENAYGELRYADLCVSSNRGNTEYSPFGSLQDYDRIMTTANANCPITEECVLWLDGADTDGPYNYTVRKRAPWKNSVSYAIKQVTVRE